MRGIVVDNEVNVEPSWIKTIAGQARTKLRGLARVRWSFTLAAAAYNLVRLPRLLAGSAG